MRDPYDILGVKRGASFEEIKAAYRKACKAKHPDAGGSHDEFIELQSAYERILTDLKGGRKQERAEAHQQHENEKARTEQPGSSEDMWTNEAFWRDLDEEMEDLRRSAEFYQRAFRERRAKAWQRGDRIGWAKLGFKDVQRFLDGILRAGAKGILILIAALAGVGAIITQFNLISALIIFGSGFALFVATAMKNDKAGTMSAFLLLFGLVTIWSPAVRAAVLGQPFATLSALICLALIFKFIEQRSVVGLATGGTLALYVLSLIGEDVQKQSPSGVALTVPPITHPSPPAATVNPPAPASQRENPSQPAPSSAAPPRAQPTPAKPAPPVAPEPRTLLAANGSMLKFVAGVPYQLRIHSGMTTRIAATQGKVAFYRGDDRIGDCVDAIELLGQAAGAPYQEFDRTIRACGADAVFKVTSVQ